MTDFDRIDSLVLVVMAGLPGTGKSTIALGIGTRFAWPVIDKDVIASALLDAGIDENAVQPAAYDASFALTKDLLVRQRRSVILDTPCVYPPVLDRARAIAEQADATMVPVLCLADRDLRNHRVVTRPALRSQPVGRSRTPGLGRERFAHVPDDTIDIVTDGSVDQAIAEATDNITQLLHNH